MIIPKKNRIAVYSLLFKEGVLVAKKDYYKPKHDDVDVPNIQVMQLMKSLVSRGLVKQTMNWQYFYWYLNEEGVAFLREYLHLPEDIIPSTHKKKTGGIARVGQTPGEREGGGKNMGAPGDFKPDFDRRGGGNFGRGRDEYRSEGGGGGFGGRGFGGGGRGGGATAPPATS